MPICTGRGMKPALPVALWSAVPTPLTPALTVDEASVARLIEASVRDGVEGLFVGGTCGEGPWLPDRERRRLMEAAVRCAGGRLKIAAQVSDNSVPRVLDNMAVAAAAGVDIAIIAPPATMLNATADRVTGFFVEAASRSPLPVGIYDLGKLRPVMIPDDRLKEVYLVPQVVLVKDSSGAPERRALALAARAAKPALRLLNGDEFRCLEYLIAGYDGCMFGGAVAVMPQLRRIAALWAAGQIADAASVEAEMKEALYGIYGGKAIACWLTGLKHYLVCRGVFASSANFLGYPLTAECREFIERYAIAGEAAAPHRVGAALAPT